MANLNKHYGELKASYLFSDIAKRVKEYEATNPELSVIRCGIGDVTMPLTSEVVKALHKATDDMANSETFKGYGPEQGYDFLRNNIAKFDYNDRGIDIKNDEIFVSDGAKSDCANITELFGLDNKVAICDPVYPVYNDTNIMIGRGQNIVYMDCNESNNFSPEIPDEKVDLIYLCFPNNPTGVTATKEYLEKWVKYANENEAIILYDSAYEAFITEKDVPKSIFEIDGARTCAIEFRSFSKTAGFTGLRCAYTVIPKELERNGMKLNQMWLRRQTTKFNGVPYIVQCAANAIFSEQGQKEVKENIAYYLRNANYMKETLEGLGLKVYGGTNAPYVWVKTPNGMNSWDFFDIILNKAGVVCTPGSGFGKCGDEYIRFSSFNSYENTVEAMERFKKVL